MICGSSSFPDKSRDLRLLTLCRSLYRGVYIELYIVSFREFFGLLDFHSHHGSRIAYIDHSGICIIGMKRVAMIPLLSFEIVVNVSLPALTSECILNMSCRCTSHYFSSSQYEVSI
jgi:hypothetical protein